MAHKTPIPAAPVRALDLLDLPAVLIGQCLSYLCVGSFLRAAQACHALDRHARAASPHTIRLDMSLRGLARLLANNRDLPASLLRLRPSRLWVDMHLGVRHIHALCTHMHSSLRHLRISLARGATTSIACLSALTHLQVLDISGNATLLGADALRHLTQLTAFDGSIDMKDTADLPTSCRTLAIRWNCTPVAECRDAWVRMLQRPLTALTLGIGLIPNQVRDQVRDIARHCTALRKLDVAECGDLAPLSALPLLTELAYIPDMLATADDGLSRLTTLRSLSMGGYATRFGGLASLSSLTGLETLNLARYYMRAADVAVVCDLRSTVLTDLQVSIESPIVPHLDVRGLSSLSALKYLGLGHNHTTRLRLHDLPHPLPRLEQLGASNPDIAGAWRLLRMYPTLTDVFAI